MVTLLRVMAGYIRLNHWCEEHLRHPEFVHEAFQRLILNFLLEARACWRILHEPKAEWIPTRYRSSCFITYNVSGHGLLP